MPSFNLQGESRVNTLCGGVVTLLIAMVVLAFATHKAFEMVDPHNPSIVEIETASFFDKDET